MRITARVYIQLTVLSCLVAWLPVPDAVAGSLVTSYNGTVNPQVPGDTYPGNVKVNDAISGSFGYIASQFSGNAVTGIYTFSGSSPEGQSFTLNVSTPGYTPSIWADGYVAGGATFTITMAQPKAGETTMDIHVLTSGGSPPSTKSNPPFVDLLLTSNTYTGGKALPSTLATLGEFLTTTATLTWDGPTFTGTITAFNGIETQSVPEPSSLVIAVTAMAICGSVS